MNHKTSSTVLAVPCKVGACGSINAIIKGISRIMAVMELCKATNNERQYMKEIFTKAIISNVKIENNNGTYERTLTAEIDGANEIIWLTDRHTNTVVSPAIDETHSMAITKKQLDELVRVMARVEA